MRSRRLLIAAGLTVALAAGGCSGTPDTDSADTENPQAATATRDERWTPATSKHHGGTVKSKPKPKPRAGTALAALGTLTVKGRAQETGYDREQFGGDWASIDGCDMRQRILQRDLRRLIYEAGSDCEISSGILDDRYTASKIIFHRGGASEVDIDHVVALSDAWQKGCLLYTSDAADE